jgi:hypothetical protein
VFKVFDRKSLEGLTEVELVRLAQSVFGFGVYESFSGKNSLIKSFLKVQEKELGSSRVSVGELELCSRYLGFSRFTYPGLYEKFFRSLTGNVSDLCEIVADQLIIEPGGVRVDKPSVCSVDQSVFESSVAMTAEILRRNSSGFVRGRDMGQRLVCGSRGASVLLTSVLKSMFYPARVRVGFVGGRGPASTLEGNWFVEVREVRDNGWKILDLSRSVAVEKDRNCYEVGRRSSGSSAIVWRGIRNRELDGNLFSFCGVTGPEAVLKMLIFDFNSLMGEEVPERFVHSLMTNGALGVDSVRTLDELATLMLDVDKNIDALQVVWDNDVWLKGENRFVVNL